MIKKLFMILTMSLFTSVVLAESPVLEACLTIELGYGNYLLKVVNDLEDLDAPDNELYKILLKNPKVLEMIQWGDVSGVQIKSTNKGLFASITVTDFEDNKTKTIKIGMRQSCDAKPIYID